MTWCRLIERLPKRLRDDIGLYDAMLMFYRGLIAFDHVQHRLWIVRNVYTEGPGTLREKYKAAVKEILQTRELLEAPVEGEKPRKESKGSARVPKVRSNVARGEYLQAVRKAQQYIRAGDIFQVVIGQRFSAKTNAAPFDVYRELRALNPSPYLFYLQLNDVYVVGSSPEMLVKVQGKDVFYRPIAGTRWRGKDEAEDARLEREMLASEKERAEHIMLVDLGTERSGARVRIRQCESGKVDDRGALFARDAPGVQPARAVARRCGLFRCADGLLSGGHGVWGAEGSRDGDHRGIGEDEARNLRGRHFVSGFCGQSGFVHRIAHHGHQKWSGTRAGGRRSGGRLNAGRGVRRIGEQVEGAAASAGRRHTRRTSGEESEAEAVILLLDNYDSFTYNLAQYLGELGCTLEVHRNDKISVEEIVTAEAGADRDLARAVYTAGSRNFGGTHPEAGRKIPHS